MHKESVPFRPFRLTLSLKFIIGCSITLIIALGVSFYVLAGRQERLILQQLEEETKILFKQIVLTRKWIADHGGIFVEKLPWVKPNPYMKDPEIADISGKKYVRESPATVTKGLSLYAKDKGVYWFHITSLKLTNPENAPDAFERAALVQFEKEGVKELTAVEPVDKSRFFRYIAPLYIEDSCLRCHAAQGYKIGEVRGAISITIPMDKTFAEIASNRKRMLLAALITVSSLVIALFLMMKNLVLTPMRKLKASIRQFSEGAFNKDDMLRTGDEFEDLSIAFSDMAGALTGYHNTLNDKIRLLEANKLLSESNLRKSDFIARASHELRTPLTSIKGAMDYISAKLSAIPPEKIADTSLEDLSVFFQVIKKNAERLVRMVTTMLDIERIEMGVAEFHYHPANLSYLAAESMTSLQVNADERGISLYAALPDRIPVCVDEDKIRQVIVNLLSNAIKFSPEGSEIMINAFATGDSAITEISDNGPGIPLEEQEHIFEKFYKFYRNGNKEGAGLGLAICKIIIEAHRGTIGVRSDGQQGSCFYFSLPLPDNTEGSRCGRADQQVLEQRKVLEIVKKDIGA